MPRKRVPIVHVRWMKGGYRVFCGGHYEWVFAPSAAVARGREIAKDIRCELWLHQPDGVVKERYG